MAAEQNIDSRLDRIENKIDQLSDAMIALARAEERLISIEKHNSNQYDRMNRFSEKVDGLQQQTEKNTTSISLLTKMIWILFSAVIGGIATHFTNV